MALRSDPDGIAPERALVFEVAGSLSDFYAQASRIAGLEFLLEDDTEIEPDDDFYSTKAIKGVAQRQDGPLGGRLYMAMPDLRALHEILRLWDLHRNNRPMPYGFSQWSTLFDLLHDLRAWGPADRVLPETLEYWRDQLDANPDKSVRFEVELWFHELDRRRAVAEAKIRTQVAEYGGSFISAAQIAPIRYHGLLVELPADRIAELLDNRDVTLGRLDDIMFLRPQSVAAFPSPDEMEEGIGEEYADEPEPTGLPIAALLDGVPLANHTRLVGRIIFDDPDDLATFAPAAKRVHGTSMASLIVHGDLTLEEAALERPLYVRPVMVYNAEADAESTPPNRLPLDVIYLAVRRLMAGDDGEAAAAPSLVVFNLSLGDINRPFAGRMSPWARLLDWLSFQYRILFLVSAGNVRHWLPVADFATQAEFLAASPQSREDAILRALNAAKGRRSLLSPAECVNALAIGALHFDGLDDADPPFHLVDPFPQSAMPNITSAVGLGYKRGIKPDLLYDGGRELVRASEDEGHVWLAGDGGGRHAGQLAAAPDPDNRGRLNLERRTVGSSNATALLTRSSVRIYDSLVEAGYDIPHRHAAVLLKSLLVHGAEWGDAGRRLDDLLGPAGRQHLAHKDNITRFLGYGRPNIERVLDCARERATLFAFGDLSLDMQDEFDVPLPPSIEGSTELRRLTTTLAWLTPVNARHQQYRSATLELTPNGDRNFSLAVERKNVLQPNHHAVDRGTVSHCVFEGESAVAFLDEGLLKLRVLCRAQAGALDEPVPYAVAISIETGVGSAIDVYGEVRAAVQPVVRATATSR